jgi:hypothetical protein
VAHTLRKKKHSHFREAMDCRVKPGNDGTARRFRSITSLATASSDAGMARPSMRAVSASMTSSNLVDCTTGRSAGFAPSRIRPVGRYGKKSSAAC